MPELSPAKSANRVAERFFGARYRMRTAESPAVEMTRVEESWAYARLEMALSLSSIGLSGFMVMHLGLLLSILLGARVFDILADFLERFYLLHAFVPVLLVMFFGHIFLAARKVPTAFPPQRSLVRHMRSLRHLDTWTWGVQVVTGVGLLLLASIHLWVILTDLPIQAAKSGARVFGVYLWFYAPYVVLVETHMSIGLYRMSVKWGLLDRRWTHRIASVWTVAVLSLGAAILVALYRIGAGQ